MKTGLENNSWSPLMIAILFSLVIISLFTVLIYNNERVVDELEELQETNIELIEITKQANNLSIQKNFFTEVNVFEL